MARRITACSISVISGTCRTGCTCSRRTKTNSSTCFGRWRTTTPVRSPFVIRAARGRARKPKPEPKLLEIGKAEVVQHGREVAIFGLGNMFEIAEEAAQKLRGERNFRRAHQSALDQTDRHRDARIFCAQRRSHLHDRRSRFAQRLRLRGDGASALADDQYAGGADRLARSIHRARRRPNSAQETRHHSRRAGGKSAAAPSQKIQAHAICSLIKRRAPSLFQL